MNLRRICIAVLVVCLSPDLSAQNALYVGEAAVDSAAVSPAISPTIGPAIGPDDPLLRALNQVLVRVTGQAGQDLVGKLGISAERARAMSLGRQFREAQVMTADGRMRPERRLRVDFDRRAIDALLDQAGLARWGRERPELLVWLAIDRGDGADYLLGDEAVDAALARASFNYGIPLARPILDAQDRVEVTPSDIRGGFTAVATPALARYGTDGLVMLELRQAGEFWTGRWAWRIDEAEYAFQRSGADPAEVIELGLGRIAESLAARFAVRPDAERLLRLSVGGLERPVHYVEVRRFLEGLTGIESLRVIGAEGDRLRFELRSASGELRQRIELTGPLVFERADLATGELFYRFAW
ncbi:MAG: hypothetical protein CVV18_03540 [Gammaproteobacteria bacterium HGW-Gammaproteobacteria-8]|nr:MAG: hypothetical protein CVV18_03540 [Gammaproteobacteria bacterium HGW-Gammaproteobacteria-8]